MGSDFRLHLSVKEGAGAFVCGEETALLASIEGRRGMPRLRPPYPAESGLWGKPTSINNVETYALVPWIFRHGAAAFAALGTAKSKGTKVFALAGKVRRGGLIEVPMGMTIRADRRGDRRRRGRADDGSRRCRSAGPPAAACPAELADTPVDYEALADAGAIMGSGGLVVLDDRLHGRHRPLLPPLHPGPVVRQVYFLPRRHAADARHPRPHLPRAQGNRATWRTWKNWPATVGAGSLCGLGRTAPNPVLSTLRYFRDEYEAHLAGRCPAGKCKALIDYRITDDCIGCTLCAQQCPADAIPMTPYARHVIDLEKCTRCDTCRAGLSGRGAVDAWNRVLCFLKPQSCLGSTIRPREVEVPAGGDLLEAARKLGIESRALLSARATSLRPRAWSAWCKSPTRAAWCRPAPRRRPRAWKWRARPRRSARSAAPRWSCC